MKENDFNGANYGFIESGKGAYIRLTKDSVTSVIRLVLNCRKIISEII